MGQLIVFFLVGLFFAWVMRSYRRYESGGFRRRAQGSRQVPLTRERLAQSELGLFVALVAKVAKADGRVDELEAELVGNMFTDISALFPDPPSARAMFKEIFNTEKELPFTLDNVAIRLRAAIGSDLQKRHMMMAFLVNLAFVDGHLSHGEEAMLLKIAALLHFSPGEIHAMLEQAARTYTHATTGSSLENAYALLGATPDEPMESVKKRYRKLVREHHPDIVKAQGASDDYIEQATEKVQQINAAYELIKKARG